MKVLVRKTLVILSADSLPIRVINLTNGYVSLKKGPEIVLCGSVTTVTNVGRLLSEGTPYIGDNGAK